MKLYGDFGINNKKYVSRFNLRKKGRRKLQSYEEEVKEYCETFPSYIPVYKALIGGSEDEVKDELCRYIDDKWNGSPPIKDYINSVNWV